MKKGLVFTTDEKMCVKEFGEPLYKTVGEAVGGHIEIVHPKGLEEPYCMVVNEEGLLMDLPLNAIGSVWYRTWEHGHPIVGDIVVMKEGFENGDRDLLGLTDEEILEIMSIASEISDGRIEEVNM